MAKCRYDEKTKSIGGDTWLLYEADSIKHLSVKARRRLAELSDEHPDDPRFDYEAAEKILIAEGLYRVKQCAS